MLFRFALLLAFTLLASLSLHAQEPGDDIVPEYPDSTEYAPMDTTYMEYDTTGYSIDTTYGGDYGYGDDVEFGDGGSPSGGEFGPGGGVYFGPTFEVTTLSPSALDRELDGDLVLYGVQAFAIINGWMLGGNWTSATLYDMSTNYDEFEFGYRGFLTGYDLDLFEGVSFRITALIGGGDLTMIKKRPDLALVDTTDNEILERHRMESFFMLRPGASIGYAALPFLDIRVGADFLYPIGGSEVHDLKRLTYGLQLMLGFGK